ncbi:unnamed protein product, partial [Allacma fusca]
EPESRVFIIKPCNDMEKLSTDSTDVAKKGILDHYVARPDTLKSICLANFVSWFEFSKQKTGKEKMMMNLIPKKPIPAWRRDVQIFITALNHLAVEKLTPKEVILFKARHIGPHVVPPGNSTHLFFKNKDIDDQNNAVLRQINPNCVTFMAIDMIIGPGDDTSKSYALNLCSFRKTSETFGLPKSLLLCVGAPYMITWNINTTDDLGNGATGCLRDISYRTSASGEAQPCCLHIEFENERVGESIRKQNRINPKEARAGDIVKKELYRLRTTSAVNFNRFDVLNTSGENVPFSFTTFGHFQLTKNILPLIVITIPVTYYNLWNQRFLQQSNVIC